MPGYNSNYGGSTVYVDISDLAETLETAKKNLSEPKFNEMLRRTFNDAGKKVKTIVRQEVPKKYAVTASWAGSAVGWPKTQGGAGQVGVVVPIQSKRGSIGGLYHTAGSAYNTGPKGAYGFNKKGAWGKIRGKKAAKIRAKIVKGQTSTMPDTMAHQGGNPPFLYKGIAFTRTTRKSHPIASVVGLGVPQMPINKSKEDVQREIKKVVEKRLVHHFEQLWK